MEQVVLLLGGNIGNVSAGLDRAVELLGEVDGVSVAKCSVKVTTKPWGFKEGGGVAPFVNQAVVLDVASWVEPLELLGSTQQIERELGRDRELEGRAKQMQGERYASRSIDIDIIFWGDRVIYNERLRVPHPLMQERDFVLGPIVEIMENFIHPVLGVSCRELLDRL